MTHEEAIKVLECMAVDLTGCMGGLSDKNPLEDVCRQRLEAINTVLSTLTQPNNWISVEDRLPEDGKYLCCFSSLGLGWCIDVLSYASDLNSVDDWDFYNEHHGGFYDLDSECGYYEISGVAYWRPLPEPPEEE